MKKLILTALAVFAAGASLQVSAQEKEKEMKTGWSFGILPTATYSVDNGFQAGAFGDVYYYGDGSTYPDPLHKISWEASYFTHSQRSRFYLAYDSKYLIPGMRLNASATYVNDPLYSFWGYNGGASLANLPQPYDTYWTNKTTDINYFGMSRQMLRILANVQGRITDHLNWAAGINFWNWTLGDMRDTGYPKEGSKDKFYYNKDNTLYRDYQKLGLIKDNAPLHRHPHPHPCRRSRLCIPPRLAADHRRRDPPVYDSEQSPARAAQHDFRRLRFFQHHPRSS